MARRLSMAVLAGGIGLAGFVPAVGIVTMVGAAVALAIIMEHDLPSDEAAGQAR